MVSYLPAGAILLLSSAVVLCCLYCPQSICQRTAGPPALAPAASCNVLPFRNFFCCSFLFRMAFPFLLHTLLLLQLVLRTRQSTLCVLLLATVQMSLASSEECCRRGWSLGQELGDGSALSSEWGLGLESKCRPRFEAWLHLGL